jgi:hypothetical protein
MRIVQTAGALALAIPFVATAADPAQLKAGRWEETMTMTGMTFNGAPVPISGAPQDTKSRFVCIDAEEAIDPAKHFLSIGQEGKCVPNGMVSEGRIHVIGQCTTEKFGSMLITGTGTYRFATYDVGVKMTAKLKDRPVAISMTAKGRYVGACDGSEVQ